MIAPSQFMTLNTTLDPIYQRNCNNNNNNNRHSYNLNNSINRYSSLPSNSIGFNCNSSSTLIIKDLISSMQSPNGSRNRRRYQC